ncbi:hypothetical protein DESC_730079 [Desulfosarcina cetonica]|nr:hypothetical protein DESC_730079 [Desulfosarcina cetonica]
MTAPGGPEYGKNPEGCQTDIISGNGKSGDHLSTGAGRQLHIDFLLGWGTLSRLKTERMPTTPNPENPVMNI